MKFDSGPTLLLLVNINVDHVVISRLTGGTFKSEKECCKLSTLRKVFAKD